MAVLQKHRDGEWFTQDYEYKNRKLQIKMRDGHGAKIHIWNVDGTKVEKTFRYSFCTKEKLLEVSKKWINNQKN